MWRRVWTSWTQRVEGKFSQASLFSRPNFNNIKSLNENKVRYTAVCGNVCFGTSWVKLETETGEAAVKIIPVWWRNWGK